MCRNMAQRALFLRSAPKKEALNSATNLGVNKEDCVIRRISLKFLSKEEPRQRRKHGWNQMSGRVHTPAGRFRATWDAAVTGKMAEQAP